MLKNHLLATVVAATVLSAGHTSVLGADYTVTKAEDTADGICDSDCSLREAIADANSGPGADVVTVPPGIYMLTRGGIAEDSASTGDLDITDDLTISGVNAQTVIIDGQGIDRILHVLEPAVVNISSVTIRNGYVGESPPSNRAGGGIYNAGTLTLTNVDVTGNQSPDRRWRHFQLPRCRDDYKHYNKDERGCGGRERCRSVRRRQWKRHHRK